MKPAVRKMFSRTIYKFTLKDRRNNGGSNHLRLTNANISMQRPPNHQSNQYNQNMTPKKPGVMGAAVSFWSECTNVDQDFHLDLNQLDPHSAWRSL
jgi:hypothetical protein